MVDPERERDAMKQEAFDNRSEGSYVLGISQNRSLNPIMRDVKTLEDNEIILFTFMCQEEIQTYMSMKSL